MTESGDDKPEQLLSDALRAQAVGGSTPEPVVGGSAGKNRQDHASPGKLPVVRVLLFALVLGVLAGAIAAAISVS